jgi:Ca2+-binding EF-hand superfamily protein
MSSSSNPSKEEIEDALAMYDSNKDAYQALQISKLQFERLVKKYQVEDVYTKSSDEEVVEHITKFNHEHPTGGEILLTAYLKTKGIKIRRDRLRRLVRENDINYEERKKFHSKKIVRREYFSYGGNVMI